MCRLPVASQLALPGSIHAPFLLFTFRFLLQSARVGRHLIIACLLMVGCVAPREIVRSAPAIYADRTWIGPIWVSAAADFEEFAAAQSLAEVCEQVTGTRPEVREEVPEDATTPSGIFIGRTRAAERAGVTSPGGDGDGAVRRTVDGRLYLIGNSPIATRIAVGRLCEQALGVTFVMPGIDGMDYAPLSQVAWPADEIWRPAFVWRMVSGLNDAESIEWGRRVGFGNRPSSTHGLYRAFPASLHATNPELFPLVDGQRQAPSQGGRSAQPNLAHPEAPAIAAADTKAWLTRNSWALVVPLGINDSLVYDAGAEAAPRGLFDGRPNRSDYVFGFLNRVAALDWSPGGDRAIGCLAYLDSLACPSFPVHPAVFPAICGDRIQYVNPQFAAMDAANLAAWGRSGARRLGTWDYYFGRDVVLPRWHLGAQVQSIRAAHTAGVCSWFAELDPLWAYDAPKAWIAAKLTDNPSSDPAALADRWARAAYGPAAPAMRSLQRRIEQVWSDALARRTPGQWLIGWRDGCSASELITPSLEQGAARAFEAARAALAAAPRDTRHNRMRARLAQFTHAWQLSVAEARRCRLALSIGSGNYDSTQPATNLWQDMLAAEMARDRAQSELNRNIWPGSQPVKWSASTQTNPWPLIAARLTPAERTALVLPAEAPAAARVALALARRTESMASKVEVASVPIQGWTERFAPPVSRTDTLGFLAVTAPQGRTFRQVAVAAGETLRITIDAEAASTFTQGMATLTVRFPGAPKPPTAKPLHAPAPPPVSTALPYAIRIWGRTVLEVPVGEAVGTVAEVEIAFVDKLPPIRKVTIERLALRR